MISHSLILINIKKLINKDEWYIRMNIKELYKISLDKIREVGDFQRKNQGMVINIGKDKYSSEGTPIHNALTLIDIYSQDAITSQIIKYFPDVRIIGEENTLIKNPDIKKESRYTIAEDPLDGTEIYINGEKDYSIMLGVLDKGKLVMGIGYYPARNETFASIKGEGAWKIDSYGNKSYLKQLKDVHFDEKNLAVHYRFLNPPYDVLANNLLSKGYVFATNKRDFGTNLTGILRIAEGKSVAFIGPHISLHDFSAAAAMIKELGGVIRRFDYNGKDDYKSWEKKPDYFQKISQEGSPPRYRVIIARDEETIEKIIREMLSGLKT